MPVEMLKIRLYILSFCCLISLLVQAQEEKDFSILKFGATAGTKQYNTAAIQQAIDAAAVNGGGRVIVPAGNYLTGALYLRRAVELHLEKGAILSGAAELNQYKKEGKVNALINAIQVNRIAITGEGIK